jgi:glutathione S-transferase
MLWRYSETYTTDAKSIAAIKAAQDQRLTGILTPLDEELGKKKFLLGDKISACDHCLFMLALWCKISLDQPRHLQNFCASCVSCRSDQPFKECAT